MASTKLTTLTVTRPSPGVVNVALSRPAKRNAMNRAFWREFRELFVALAADSECRCILVSAQGDVFTAGLDLMDHMGTFGGSSDGSGSDGSGSGGSGGSGGGGGRDAARSGLALRTHVHSYQDTFTAIERCPQPVVVAVHGPCVGGGVDLATACDIRLCSEDAYFCVKEVDVGLAADVGTLQRLPKVVGNDSLVRELALTARKLQAAEALSCGLVSRVVAGGAAGVHAAGLELAKLIASKSPVAVVGTKRNLIFSRDHSVADGLEYVSTWNSNALQTEDVATAAQAFFTKSKATFSKL